MEQVIKRTLRIDKMLLMRALPACILLAGLLFAGTACRRQAAPMVGISCGRTEGGSDALGARYVQAVLRGGGVPFIIPTVETPEQAEAVIERLDGIVFSGGEDVNPAWYGEAVWNESVQVNPVRDRSDSLLARAAVASGMPILAICRGQQLMNVVLGGSLYQDIPTQLPEARQHRGGITHKIGAEPGSFLARVFGPDSLTVNSWHHQAVKSVAPGLRVVARADDGVVEAMENEQVWAVQFHPESLLLSDDSWLPLFQAFTGRCRRSGSK